MLIVWTGVHRSLTRISTCTVATMITVTATVLEGLLAF
jgi:hypothetical protein